MQDNKIYWLAFAIFISVAGYYLTKDKVGSDALIPNKIIQPTQVVETLSYPVEEVNQMQEIEIQRQAGIQVQILQEKNSLDKRTLPPALPSEEAFLDADDNTWVFVEDINAVQVNHGDTLDPDIENYPQTFLSGDEYLEDIGEYLDPEQDISSTATETIMTPQYIGSYIDPDTEKVQAVVQDTMEEVINLGEYLNPDLHQ